MYSCKTCVWLSDHRTLRRRQWTEPWDSVVRDGAVRAALIVSSLSLLFYHLNPTQIFISLGIFCLCNELNAMEFVMYDLVCVLTGVGFRGQCFSTWTCEEFPGVHNGSLMALEQCCSNLWGQSWKNASDGTCLTCTYTLLPGTRVCVWTLFHSNHQLTMVLKHS